MRQSVFVMIRYLGIPLMLLLFSQYSLAQSTSLLAAKEAYDAQNYSDAIEIYNNILEQGSASAALHYNLGNSYFKSGDVGRAILHYEKSLKLKNDPDTRHNLEIANELKKDNLAKVDPFVLNQWWLKIRDLMSSSAWAMLAWFIMLLVAVALGIWLLAAERSRRKLGFSIGVSLLPMGILCLIISFASKKAEEIPEHLIVLSENSVLYFAPDTLSDSIIELHPGTKAEIDQYLSGWYRVRLSDGEEGWLKEDEVSPI